MTRLSGDIGEIYGKLPGPIIEAWQEFSTAIWTDGRIDAPLRELMRMRSAQLTPCAH